MLNALHGCGNIGVQIPQVCTVNAGLGVSQQYSEMHLLPEPLFSVPTDGVHIMSIEATQNGRIFMAGKDGCLYELAYQVCIIPKLLGQNIDYDTIQEIVGDVECLPTAEVHHLHLPAEID